MSAAMTTTGYDDSINMALIQGDLSRLSPNERRAFYLKTCESLGLNPMTKPFEYLRLNGKEILYATKACTEQLRQRDGISVTIVSRTVDEGIYVVTSRATTPSGRVDESTGAVAIERLTGEARANAMMKAETKSKRRVTLSICGLGMLDESEVHDIPGARTVAEHDVETGEIVEPPRPQLAKASPVPSGGDLEAKILKTYLDAIVAAQSPEELTRVAKAIKGESDRGNIGLESYAKLRELGKIRKGELQAAASLKAGRELDDMGDMAPGWGASSDIEKNVPREPGEEG